LQAVLQGEAQKRRLEAEGLFDPERKRPLPEAPRRAAVITSPSGAAVRDFLKVLHRRFQGVEVAVYPTPVQGEKAPAAMIQALEDLAAWGWPEVIVLTRGGGSPEDLWAFNDEGLARAIAACPIPVVSAVGHEIDFCISDLAADLRAPTPSAAAELLVRNQADLIRRLDGLRERLALAGRRMISRRRVETAHLARALGDPRRRLADQRLRVDDLLVRAGHAFRAGLHQRDRRLWGLRERLLALRPDRKLARLEARRRELRLRLDAAAAAALGGRRARLNQSAARLRSLGPLSILGRGYALVADENGSLLRDSAQTQKGRRLDIRLARGRLIGKVEEVVE
jgi:exodeoxyribonuclease VII large subunit